MNGLRLRYFLHSFFLTLNYCALTGLSLCIKGPFNQFRGPQSALRSGLIETENPITMREVSGVKDIVDDYDVFLLDMWGVMHDGSKPYDGVLDAINRLRESGKTLIILSNSSKRKNNSFKMLAKLGFNPDDFQDVITSGEVAYQMMETGSESWEPLNGNTEKNVFVFGSGDGDKEYCESCGWRVSSLDDASLLLARGTFTVEGDEVAADKNQDATLYETTMTACIAKAVERRLPMLVSNPDKIRPDVDRPPMPGSISVDYIKALGESDNTEVVKRVGKPFPDVYRIALEGVKDLSRVCMIGDALETDVTGGSSFGIDTIWVLLDGIHEPDYDKNLSVLEGANTILKSFNSKTGTYCTTGDLSPNILMSNFKW